MLLPTLSVFDNFNEKKQEFYFISLKSQFYTRNFVEQEYI